jgi:Ca-activated chloride channel homolog
MADFHLLRPYWLLAAIPVLFIWLQYQKKSQDDSRFRDFIDEHLLEHLLVGKTERKQFTPLNLLLVVLVLTTVALSGPTFRQEASPFAGDDAGLMVLIKLGKSMSAEDLQPSRLERAKQKLEDLLELRKGKSTGLVVYSGSSHLVMPLTSDGRVITLMIEDLTPDLMPREGDELASAMALGQKMLEQSGNPGSMLIIADSVSPGQQPLVEKIGSTTPAQFYSFNPPGSGVDPNLQAVAEIFGTRPVEVSLDDSDVKLLAKKAQSSLSKVTDGDKTKRWRDDGYLLVPLICACFLLWFRKGWMVK